MTPQNKKMFGNRRAVSPILATVLLLGITVVGGGLAYSLMAQGSNTASTQNIITLENAQAIKGTSHSDLTATIKNGGSLPWKKVEMTVAKSELSEPLLYESLHEIVSGCSAAATNGACTTANTVTLDNALRAQWLASLNTGSDTTAKIDNGEGIAAGRKFVFQTDEVKQRDILILNGTWVGKAFGNGPSTATNNLKKPDGTTAFCNAAGSTTWVDCSHVFNALDKGTTSTTADSIQCKQDTNNNLDVVCKVFTHKKLGAMIQSGQSVQIYADAFTKDVVGLNNQKVQTGDGLVTNIVVEAENGSTARYQTVIKVVGI